MTNKIFAFLTANEENQQALVFEELTDSQAAVVVGGQNKYIRHRRGGGDLEIDLDLPAIEIGEVGEVLEPFRRPRRR